MCESVRTPKMRFTIKHAARCSVGASATSSRVPSRPAKSGVGSGMHSSAARRGEARVSAGSVVERARGAHRVDSTVEAAAAEMAATPGGLGGSRKVLLVAGWDSAGVKVECP
jgi:hypothetical protein